MSPLETLLQGGQQKVGMPGTNQDQTKTAQGLQSLLNARQPMPPVQQPGQIPLPNRKRQAVPNLFPEKNAQASQVRTGITPRMSAQMLQQMRGNRNAAV